MGSQVDTKHARHIYQTVARRLILFKVKYSFYMGTEGETQPIYSSSKFIEQKILNTTIITLLKFLVQMISCTFSLSLPV